jgi:thioredoxin 1
MNTLSRRSLFALFGTGLALAAIRPALALGVTDYTPEVLAAAKASGKPFLLDFYATWCSTCKAQERVIEGLVSENPAYAGVTIIRVDWDKEERGDLVKSLSIPRRSTLVVLKGEAELGRIVAGTGKAEIAALMDLAL